MVPANHAIQQLSTFLLQWSFLHKSFSEAYFRKRKKTIKLFCAWNSCCVSLDHKIDLINARFLSAKRVWNPRIISNYRTVQILHVRGRNLHAVLGIKTPNNKIKLKQKKLFLIKTKPCYCALIKTSFANKNVSTND